MPSRTLCVRILLDENLDRRLKRYLPPEAEALTVQEREDLTRFDIAIVLLEARSNKLADLSSR